MPVNKMNTGSDFSVSYYDGASGALVPLGDVQDVKSTCINKNIKSAPFNAPPRFGYVPDGYKVEFTITRTGFELEEFFMSIMDQFNAGRVINPGVLQETINNPDGSVSRYQYTNFVSYMPNVGEIAHDRVVTLRVEGMASTKEKIA